MRQKRRERGVGTISEVVVEEKYEKKEEKKDEKKGEIKNKTPILRLNVNPQTNAVSTNSTNIQPFIFRHQNPQVTASYDDYTETYNTNETGLSWGVKHAKDKLWEEKWMQQKENNADGTSVTTGRSTGYDKRYKQRWTETWSRSERYRKIEKTCEEIDEEGTPLQEWTETIEIEDNTTIIRRSGTDLRGAYPREWKETKESREGKANEDKVVELRQFDETVGDRKKGHRHAKMGDGRIKEQVSYEDETENWEDTWYVSVDGSRWGLKTGTNSSKEHWTEKWNEDLAGNHTNDKWIINEQKTTSRGCKLRYANDIKEETREEWVEVHDGLSVRTETDTTHSKPKQGSEKLEKWGTRISRILYQNEIQEEFNEHWYDNTTEYKTETTRTKISKDQDGNEKKHLEHNVIGDRYTDGTKWEEKERTIQGIHEKSLYIEKSWRESSGNSWGNKNYKEYEGETMTLECEEKWYDNGSEKQSDKWRTYADGHREGEKSGENRNDMVCWQENWKDGNQTVVTKTWISKKHDRINEWGEETGHDGCRAWKNDWSRRLTDGGGEEWKYIWDSAEDGAIKVEKIGTTWRRTEGGDETLNWYSNRHGENPTQNEMWAYNEGYSIEKGKWREQWNERPNVKTAIKNGTNNQGDEWTEFWDEKFDGDRKIKTYAEKKGQNAAGDVWEEKWEEEGEQKKYAKKTGSNALGEEWFEEWGEEVRDDGSGEKWCNKRAGKDGNVSGQSWGDKWSSESGHHWGEKWDKNDVQKWWKDTCGKPRGC